MLDFKLKAIGSDITVSKINLTLTGTGATPGEIADGVKIQENGNVIAVNNITLDVNGIYGFTLSSPLFVGEGETALFSVYADINEINVLGSNFTQGDSLKIDYSDVAAKDSNNDNVLNRTGSANGNTQTFYSKGITLNLVNTSAVKTSGDGEVSDTGTFTITFDVTAFGGDMYIDNTAPTTTGGITESDLEISGTGTDISTITSSNAIEQVNGFLVPEDQTKRFTITTNITPTESGFFDVSLTDLLYALTDVNGDLHYTSLDGFKTSALSLNIQEVIPDTTPPTGTMTINNNAVTTDSNIVTLNFADVSEDVTLMELGNGEQGSFQATITYENPHDYTLPDNGNGTYTVRVRFTDSSGNQSEGVISDDITLNTSNNNSPLPVELGLAGNYRILAETAITTTGTTAITGDIGISPNGSTSMTGFGLILDGSGTYATSPLVNGKIYASNYTEPTPANLTTAVSNMETAYTDAKSRATTVLNAGSGDLAGLTLVAGVYTFDGVGNVIITDNMTLSGNASDVWIFQIPGTLDISANKKINLTGGAQASNIFWAVTGTTTLEAGSTFEGTILAGPGASTIAMQNGATLNGRALGQTDVTLIGNTVREDDSVVNNSTVPATASYDKNGGTTLDIAMTLNGNTLTDIKNGEIMLTPTTDYTVTGSTVTLAQTYMQAQSVGTTTLTFVFSAGLSDTTDIAVTDSTSGGEEDTTPPTGTILINNGAETTDNSNVVLNFADVSEDVTLMELANGTQGSFQAIRAYENPHNYTLPDNGNGTYTVRVRFTDSSGNQSEGVISDDIEFSALPSSTKIINSFTINGNGVINEDKTISVNLPFGTDVTSLTPVINYTGASINPESGSAQDFSGPVTYVVTAEDETTESYVVTVTVAEEVLVDTTVLGLTLDLANSLIEDTTEGTNPGEYQEGSQATLQGAIDTAQGVLDNPESTQEEVDNAVDALNDAIQVFEESVNVADEVDTGALSSTIDFANELIANTTEGELAGQYPAGSQATLQTAIDTAQAVLDNPNSTQTEINTALDNLNDAITTYENSMNPMGSEDPVNDTILDLTITLAEDLISSTTEGDLPGQYPEDSQQTLQDAIDTAQEVLDNSESTQIDIDNALDDLQDAIDTYEGSVNPPIETEPDNTVLGLTLDLANSLITDTTEGTEPGEYPTSAYEALQDAIDSAQAVFNNLESSQSEIDAAVNALNDAIQVFEGSVNIEDTEAPVINLSGSSTMNIAKGNVFTDPGATCTDNIDATCNVVVGGETVDTSIVKTYTITYSAVDNAGNNAEQKTRTVNVNEPAITTELNSTIDEASNLLDDAVVGTDPGEYSQDALDDLEDAIISAQTILDNPNPTQDQVDTANTDLENAIQDFKDSVVPAPQTQSSSGGGGGGGSSYFYVTTGVTTNIKDVSVTLNSTTNRSGTVLGWFEYGTLNTLKTSTETAHLAFDKTKNSLTQNLEKLTPATVYYYRAVAQSGSTIRKGNILSFTTGPAGKVLGESTFKFLKNMKRGSRLSPDVMELQKFLNTNMQANLVVDGIFGPITKAAVIKFQLANKLVGDGIVGPLTRAVLNK
jgi:peptidoglycan hydrolase-like protein with peptidoglycan-binding domain